MKLVLWIVFAVVVLGMLALDLGVFHRESHEVGFKEAITWSGVWIGLALLFNLAVWLTLGPQPGLEFLTAYLIEKSLSVDNVFVFALVFGYFAVPAAYQHRVLFWGIVGALAFRAAFIAGGIALLEAFHWTVYVIGAILLVTATRLFFEKDRRSTRSVTRSSDSSGDSCPSRIATRATGSGSGGTGGGGPRHSSLRS